MGTRKRIAILSHRWHLAAFTLRLATDLVEAGFDVDFFYGQSLLVDMDVHKKNDRVRYIPFVVGRMPLHTERECKVYLERACEKFVRADTGPYHALIGVEKIDLALAFFLGSKLSLPYVYWSLELYDKKHTEWYASMVCPDYWLKLEARARKTAVATIIQDSERGDALDEITRCTGQRLYLPICIGKDDVQPQGGHFLHDLCDIAHDKRILLQYGSNRLSHDWIVRIADSLPDSWLFVLHGLTPEEFVGLKPRPNLYISTKRQAESDIPALVASASVGLVHYDPTYINDVLTARSSEKMARYLTAGIPVVAYDVGNFASVLRKYSCGVTYCLPEEVGSAVQLLDKKQLTFHHFAEQAGNFYISENASSDVVDFFYSLTKKVPLPEDNSVTLDASEKSSDANRVDSYWNNAANNAELVGTHPMGTGNSIEIPYRHYWEWENFKTCLPEHPVAILELGCGAGRWGISLAPHASRYVGIDLSAAEINYARARAEHLHLHNLEFREGLVQNYEDEPGTFDIVYFGGLAMYLNDDELRQTLQKARSLLKTNGILVLRETTIVGDCRYERRDTSYFAVYRKPKEYIEMAQSEGFSFQRDSQSYSFLRQTELWQSTALCEFVKWGMEHAPEETFGLMKKWSDDSSARHGQYIYEGDKTYDHRFFFFNKP